MKAATYGRYSTDRQSETSLSDQQRICSEYAARHGWQVIEHYSDAGISGATFGARPGFQRLRADAMAGKFDVIVVVDTTRLSRSQELAPLVDLLRYQGVRVVGVSDAFDSDAGTADMQAGLSGIMSVEFRRMIRARTHAALESRARNGKSAGGRCYGYAADGAIDKGESFIVREIFGRFAAGESTRTIAADLNARNIRSAGSTWNRTTRRCAGWAGSAVRVILRNPKYTGRVIWNQSKWVKHPESGKRKRVMRPRSEWIERTDESLRIVDELLWARVQKRTVREVPGAKSSTFRGGGRFPAKHLLSGLLKCGMCGANLIHCDKGHYQCSAFKDGHACQNGMRLSRQELEQKLLHERVLKPLSDPVEVQKGAEELEAAYRAHFEARQTRAAEQPRELQELTARIARLRDRLKAGDLGDLTADELGAAIDKAETKRQELEQQQPAAKLRAKVSSALFRAAEEYRRQLVLGLAGSERDVLRARVALRRHFGGKIRIATEPDGAVWAYWQQPQGAVFQAVVTNGSGGKLRDLSVADFKGLG